MINRGRLFGLIGATGVIAAAALFSATTALVHPSGESLKRTPEPDPAPEDDDRAKAEAQVKADIAEMKRKMPAAVAAIASQVHPRDERGAKARRARQAAKIAARKAAAT